VFRSYQHFIIFRAETLIQCGCFLTAVQRALRTNIARYLGLPLHPGLAGLDQKHTGQAFQSASAALRGHSVVVDFAG
jgi:hypothetical protein